jgi:hypothetical protein
MVLKHLDPVRVTERFKTVTHATSDGPAGPSGELARIVTHIAALRRRTLFYLVTTLVSGPVAYVGRYMPDRWVGVSLVCVPIFLVALVMLKRTGARFRLEVRRFEARPVSAALDVQADTSSNSPPQPAPVLYLRSFDDDQTAARLKGALTEEEHLGKVLGEIGPFVAVGRPGELSPEAGASRMYLEDSAWQSTVDILLATARLVVIRTGSSRGLVWEVERAVRLLTPERLLIVVDSHSELAYLVGQISKVHPQVKSNFRMGWRRVCSIQGFVVFDPSWQALPLRLRGSGFCEYQEDSWAIPKLARTLRPVFRRLEVKWRRPPLDVAKIAVALSLFGLILWVFKTFVGW